MRWEVFAWAAMAFVLIAAETLVPGAFLMWLGFAAAAMVLIVLVFANMTLLWQAVLFVLLSFLSIWIYRRYFRGKGRSSDQPALNQRANQLVGHITTLSSPIVDGQGRVQIADAFWTVHGPELPAGTRVRVTAADGMILQVEAAA